MESIQPGMNLQQTTTARDNIKNIKSLDLKQKQTALESILNSITTKMTQAEVDKVKNAIVELLTSIE